MATLIDTKPDRIEQLASSQWLFTFTDGQDIHTLHAGSEYRIVYSPSDYSGRWLVVYYRVVPITSRLTGYIQVVKERDLTADEIAHFEGLIAGQG